MSEIPYHSAYSPPVGAKPSQGCERPPDAGAIPGVVFVHDIMTSETLPDQYDNAGALYAEIPWQQGFSVFNKRASVADKRTYPEFLARIDLLARWADRPVFIIASPAAAKKLPSGKAYPIQLERPGFKPTASAVIAYNDRAPLERATTKLIDRLCREWITVGDFTCGYGNTIRAAIRNGTGFVASDVSAEAVGYICANVGGWR